MILQRKTRKTERNSRAATYCSHKTVAFPSFLAIRENYFLLKTETLQPWDIFKLIYLN